MIFDKIKIMPVFFSIIDIINIFGETKTQKNMKKILLIAAVAGMAMTSCKKDYTCECTTTSNAPGVGSTTASGSTGKMKKKDAESKCNEGDRTYSIDSFNAQLQPVTYNYTTECSIK